ncbi:hypothetical protein [Achromobacter piechaudii]|uniref:Transmembrane protein n=1 Tax=Achromobacter piechaudii TaxID=72556 RepID=A0ABN7F896_9BURK|nr:hypothetical protein [Achromobacter piechaudii]CAB3728150.1 hypothetical protein LMG1873_04556 [Achromobacter piechaudii]CAB3903805.1 hypothetical protein LMG2828_04641 [Achromobacter piechaudii]CAB3956274.1 hypothetical protein LMG6103_04721 [Achromobacter piechaudii]
MQSDDIIDMEPVPQQDRSRVQDLKDMDARRPDFPGEHLIVFGVGALLMVAGMKGRTMFKRTVLTAIGTALMGRAASGTGGIAKLARVVKKLG